MPLGASTRPPPRQKSCAACIKSKRRCSLDKPVCERCSHLKIACQYVVAAKKERGAIRATRSSRSLAPRRRLQGECAHQLGCSRSPIAGKAASPRSNYSQSFNAEDFILTINGDSRPKSSGVAFTNDWSGSSLETIMTSPRTLELTRPLDYGYVSHLISTRVQYIMDTLQDAPRSMVMENQTPWCHSLLYRARMPRSIQDAQAMCSLYLHKNDANCDAIMNNIESRVTELVNQSMPTDRLDILARTQALVLYQIIRLFDGDISAIAAIQDSISAIATSARALGLFLGHKTKSKVYPEPLAVNSTPVNCVLDALKSSTVHNPAGSADLLTSAHYDWILDESIRRTYIVTFFFLQIYRMLVLHIAPIKHANNICESFTISSHLWDAKDSFAFGTAWEEKKYVRFEGYNIKDVFSLHGKDVDRFSKMLLTLMMGIQETRTWLVERGGEL